MNTFAIITTYREDYPIILENLTREQILAIKATMLAYVETLTIASCIIGCLEVEGIDFPIEKTIFLNLFHKEYKIVPMCTIDNFE